jgi:hypothetical protein
MLYSQTKNPNMGNFWRALQKKMLVYFMGIWSILQPFGILYGHLVYFVVIWYISPRFGMLYRERSGNPALGTLQVIAAGIKPWPLGKHCSQN